MPFKTYCTASAASTILNTKTKAWRQGPRLSRPLSWGAAVIVGNQLIVTGGAASYGKDYLYNDLTLVFRRLTNVK